MASHATRSRARRWLGFAAVGALELVNSAGAATPELARAEALFKAGKAAESRDLFEHVLAADPGSVEAHLGLGRAYFALGRYAEARIAFESVLHFENLPPDLLTQVETYNQAATQYLDEGSRLTRFGYAETGFGGYRVNSTRGTDAFGGGERDNVFFNARGGGGLDYLLDDGYAVDANIDYRFRYHEGSEIRNDSDWRWRLAGSRALGENNLAVGFRGRVSYRGQGRYRNDYSIFTNYRYHVDDSNQLRVGADVRRRRYPQGALRARSRTTAMATLGWAHSLNSRAAFSATGHGGYNYSTSRDDGNSSIYGLTLDLDYTFSDSLGGFIFAWWEHDVFNTDAIHFHPDELDEGVILRREDNLYEFGGSLVWSFAPGWTFRPSILYMRDESNSVGFNYSSTEYWINVRKGF